MSGDELDVVGSVDTVEPPVHSGIQPVAERPPREEVLRRRKERKAEKRARKDAGRLRSQPQWEQPVKGYPFRTPVADDPNFHRSRNWFCPHEGCEYHDHLTPLTHTHAELRGKSPPYMCPYHHETRLVPGEVNNGLPIWYNQKKPAIASPHFPAILGRIPLKRTPERNTEGGDS